LNCPKPELAVSALQVKYLAHKNVVITIEFTTNMTGVFCVSLALLFLLHSKQVVPLAAQVSQIKAIPNSSAAYV